MAAKLIVALACFALCNANPVHLNGYLFRNGRGYSVGQGYTNTPGGQATGTATINGGVLQAYGSASNDGQNQYARNAFGVPYPGEAVAKAEIYDTPAAPVYEQANAVAEAQNSPSYYVVPAPGTVVTYEQNYEMPAEVIYEYPRTVATATQGSGTAFSNSQSGQDLTSAESQTNGGYASSSANNALNSAVVSTNSQGIASSKADIIDSAAAIGSTRAIHHPHGIHWRFGTGYDFPTPGQAQVYSQANGGTAKSTAHTNGVVTTADAQGYGSANANANLHGATINSAANSNGLGYGAARFTAGNQYGAAHSTINNALGNIKSTANSNGYGNANSHADISEQGTLVAVSNSNGYGTAASSADSAPRFAAVRSDGLPYIFSQRNTVTTQTSGQGSASARTQELNNGYRVVNSAANSFGYGAAQANASA